MASRSCFAVRPSLYENPATFSRAGITCAATVSSASSRARSSAGYASVEADAPECFDEVLSNPDALAPEGVRLVVQRGGQHLDRALVAGLESAFAAEARTMTAGSWMRPIRGAPKSSWP